MHAVGGRHTFPLDRDAEDHVYCTFEFPGPGYDPELQAGRLLRPGDELSRSEEGHSRATTKTRNKKIVVTYSSIKGNGFGGYGETVMGSKGTLILDREQEVLLFKDSDTSTKVGVKDDKGGPDARHAGQRQGSRRSPRPPPTGGPVSRGYTEEIEHWAWCIRNNAPENQPRCRAEVALGDAVIALTTQRGHRERQQRARAATSSSRKSGTTSTTTPRPTAAT